MRGCNDQARMVSALCLHRGSATARTRLTSCSKMLFGLLKTLKRYVAKKISVLLHDIDDEHFHFGSFLGCEYLSELMTVKILPVLSLL